MTRRGGTDRLGEVLAGLLQKRGYGRPLALAAWREAWARAAGERLAARSRVAGYRDGTLTIEVPSSAQRYELEAFHGSELLARLRQDTAAGVVRKLVFRVGSLPA
jgi:predicted nucleic acid-binding Zn ribbon protein